MPYGIRDYELSIRDCAGYISVKMNKRCLMISNDNAKDGSIMGIKLCTCL
jgi:hypothetical protein